MKVPLVDLRHQFSDVSEEIHKVIDAVFESQQFILGPHVKRLEEQVATYSNVAYGIGVSSGTDALLVSLMALGVGQGDGVITTPYTFFSTAGVIDRLGARPIFVDIDPDTYNLDPGKLGEFLNGECIRDEDSGRPVDRRTGCIIRAIIPVHLFGHCADMDPIMEMAEGARIDIVEDAAQAIGATCNSRTREARGQTDQEEIKEKRGEQGPARSCKAGSMGVLGCFSFFPTKNLGGFGDGGMVVTDDERMAEKIRILRVHGGEQKYHHHIIGGNFRLDELQAAILSVKFLHLETWTEARRLNARRYDHLFEEAGLVGRVHLPIIKNGNRHIFNQYVVRVPQRDKLREFLRAEGVGTEVYYPVPLHLQKCFEYLGYQRGDLAESERAADETLALPIYPGISPEQQEYVITQIKSFFNRKPNSS